MLVLATYRDDGFDRTRPLGVFLRDLATTPCVGRLPVPPLSLAKQVAGEMGFRCTS